mgnify:FL=1
MKKGDLVRWRRDQLGEAVPHRTEKDVGMVIDFDMFGKPIIVWQSGWRGYDHDHFGEFFSQIEVISDREQRLIK